MTKLVSEHPMNLYHIKVRFKSAYEEEKDWREKEYRIYAISPEVAKSILFTRFFKCYGVEQVFDEISCTPVKSGVGEEEEDE